MTAVTAANEETDATGASEDGDVEDPLPPLDALDPALARELAPERWRLVEPRVLLFGAEMGWDRADVLDCYAVAWTLLRRGRRRWNREKIPVFAELVCWIVYSLIRDKRRSRVAKNERPFKKGAEARVPAPVSTTDPDKLRDRARADAERDGVLGEIRRSLPPEHTSRRVLELIAEGVEDAAAQAERLGVEVRVVYRAVEDLKRRGRDIVARREKAQRKEARDARRSP